MNTIITTATIATSTNKIHPAKRNEQGQFTEGFPAHTIARLEYKQKLTAQIDANPFHQAFLAAHGLGHIAPSEIFAGA